MIRLTMNAKGEPILDHGTDGALVYLDHAALMDIAQRSAGDFADALAQREADLALSWLNFAELTEVSDETARSVESLIRRVLPRIAFLEVRVDQVIEAEDKLIAGTSRSAPHLDTSLLADFLDTEESLNPLDPTRFFARARTPEAIESARRGWANSEPTHSAMIRWAQAAYRDNPVVQRGIKRKIKDAPAIRPTRHVAAEAGRFIIKSKMGTRGGHHTRDVFHLMVPLSYCDFVVLDANWCEGARQIQEKLREAGLLTHAAQVFRTTDVPDFIRVLSESGRRPS